jgi:hypothetical protein
MNSYFDSGVNILVSSLIEFTYWISQIYLLFFNLFVEKGTKKVYIIPSASAIQIDIIYSWFSSYASE